VDSPTGDIIGIGLTIALLVIFGVLSFVNLSYRVRAYGVLLMPSVVYIFALFYGGADGETLIMMMACVVLAYMLFGKRGGTIVWVVSILVFVGVGWGMVTHNLTKLNSVDYSYHPATWIFIGLETLFLIGMLTMGVSTQQDAFSSAYRREQQAIEKVNYERALLEVRVAERTHELRNSNQQLEGAYQQLQTNREALLVSEKMASLGRLTAGIAHEMNTPLAAVQASLFEMNKLVNEYRELISTGDFREQTHREIAKDMGQTVDISERSISRALSFIRSVKSQTREIDDEQQRFDVVQVIEDTLMLLEHNLIRNNCQLKFEPQEKNMELQGSTASFAQVVTNLITNAIDASIPKGGGVIEVELTTDGGSLKLEVRDHGVGIPTEIRPKIFDPMFTTKSFGEGTGLGLSIVHDIITKGFRGNIDFTSQVGEGTTFSLRIPNST